MLTDFGRTRPEFGRNQPVFGRSQQELGQTEPEIGRRRRPHLGVNTRLTFAEASRTPAETSPKPTEPCPNEVETIPVAAKTSGALEYHQPGSGRSKQLRLVEPSWTWPNAARIGSIAGHVCDTRNYGVVFNREVLLPLSLSYIHHLPGTIYIIWLQHYLV